MRVVVLLAVIGVLILFALPWIPHIQVVGNFGGSGALDWLTEKHMPMIISFPVLVACLWVIVAGGNDHVAKHWAYGTTGTLIGYWFKTLA